MKHLEFEDLLQDHLFDYKDGDLFVIDDISRLELAKYEHTTVAFVMGVFCAEGRLQVTLDGKAYRIGAGDFLVYMPGAMIGDILLSQNADVKILAFAQRVIDRSVYLRKYVWRSLEFVHRYPVFTFTEREREVVSHYYGLMMLKTTNSETLNPAAQGDYQRDVVRLLFQALIFEFLMFIDRRMNIAADGGELQLEGQPGGAHSQVENDASVRQSTLLYRRFMQLLAESNGRVRSVSTFANLLNVTPKYLSKCVKEEAGHTPLDLIHETTANTIRQQLRYGDQSVKEIAAALDFPSLSFFGKFCRKYIGASPREFREKNG